MQFRVLLVCDEANLLFYEQSVIDGLKPEYNIAKSVRSPMLGLKHSAATRKKMSATRTGRKLSPEHAAAISAGQKGRPGKPKTPEQKAKVAEAIRRWCAANPGARKSKKHTEAAKQKISTGLARAYEEGRR